MLSTGHRFLLSSGLAAGLLLAGSAGASAWERLGFASYGGYGSYAGASVYTGGYGFGGGPIVSDYPRHRLVPRSTDLVPPAWGYGVYGVPSATGIRQAPAARPTVYVIDRPVARHREPVRSRILSRSRGGEWQDVGQASAGGARVVSVKVPPR